MQLDSYSAPRTISRKWYEIWWDVWSLPGVQPFKAILQEKDHSATRGLMWVGVTTFFVYLLSVGFSLIILGTQLPQLPPVSRMAPFLALSSVCGILYYPFMATISIGVVTWIIHLFAKLFGGKGALGDLTICFAAVYSPIAFLSSFLRFVSAMLVSVPGLSGSIVVNIPGMTGAISPQISVASAVVAVIGLVFSLYAFVLIMMAVSASEGIGIGGAIGTFILPIVVLVGAVVCLLNYVLPGVISSIR